MFWKCSLVLGVLLFAALPQSAFAQLKLIDLKIALKETHTWTDDSNKPPVDSDKFVVPGPGRARFTYRGSPLFKSQLFYIGVQFPGSNQKLFPGAMVDSNEKDRKETVGQPFVWSWTQEFTAEEKGMEVACELKPVDNYRGGSGWTYPPQEARFVVEWLGPGSGAGGTGTLDIAGGWKHGSSGETWTFTPKGDGTYTATEKGFGNAKGTATFKGNKIHIDYQTDKGVTGEYEVTISADGLTGKGSWTDDSPDSGSRDFVKIDQTECRSRKGSVGRITNAIHCAGGIAPCERWRYGHVAD